MVTISALREGSTDYKSNLRAFSSLMAVLLVWALASVSPDIDIVFGAFVSLIIMLFGLWLSYIAMVYALKTENKSCYWKNCAYSDNIYFRRVMAGTVFVIF